MLRVLWVGDELHFDLFATCIRLGSVPLQVVDIVLRWPSVGVLAPALVPQVAVLSGDI